MKNIELTTPALLFPAISLLLLAYTNRFITIANLIRKLHQDYKSHPDSIIMGQITSLRRRVVIIRNMQAFGILSLFLCVLCMFLFFWGFNTAGELLFGTGLVFLMASLALSLREIQLSVKALNIQLSELEQDPDK